jgi:tetratricopeptide (TPR) repeat protein
MSPGPTIISECYKCHGLFKQWTLASGNTFTARFWPDGKMDAPMMPEIPPLIHCPCCGEHIWRYEAEEIDQMEAYNPNEEVKNKYLNVEFCKDPTIDTFMLALKDENLSEGREGYIRTKLMHFFNDVNRDMEMPISEPHDMQIENYKRLLQIANKDDANDTMLRAEIYREIGEFDKCLELLKKVEDEDFLANVKALRDLCANKDSRVMEILTRDD